MTSARIDRKTVVIGSLIVKSLGFLSGLVTTLRQPDSHGHGSNFTNPELLPPTLLRERERERERERQRERDRKRDRDLRKRKIEQKREGAVKRAGVCCPAAVSVKLRVEMGRDRSSL
eukprot:sb/3476487/